MDRQEDKEKADMKWYAAKTFTERSYVLKYLELEKIRTQGITDIPSLLFLYCDSSVIFRIRYELYGKLYLYRSADKREPESIPEGIMKTFFLLAPFHQQPVIYLSVDNPAIFEGKRKRVINGPFKGCEGVTKRIKGHNRLIVKISDSSAIATPHIRAVDMIDI